MTFTYVLPLLDARVASPNSRSPSRSSFTAIVPSHLLDDSLKVALRPSVSSSQILPRWCRVRMSVTAVAKPVGLSFCHGRLWWPKTFLKNVRRAAARRTFFRSFFASPLYWQLVVSLPIF
ncbi:hypothetical protein EVAR_5053_1 [Eumeta japonica]|uniref:Uncharacterized protein n=1 Tax=Eumeta variegata TaxID=151549 RepID=A0A4C1SV00_EUMVA|nr:hypothetical protein EVAR_5053_1 [Eumeta japonica]